MRRAKFDEQHQDARSNPMNNQFQFCMDLYPFKNISDIKMMKQELAVKNLSSLFFPDQLHTIKCLSAR